MKLRPCLTSHYISAIEEGMVRKVHSMDSNGIPVVKFKNLKDIYKAEDAMLQDGHHDTKNNNISEVNEHTNLPFADRKTKTRNSDDQPESPSSEDSLEELTLSQFKKVFKRKKRKASEVVQTVKTDDDDLDLSEPLCKFKVKVQKTSPKKIIANESFPAIVNVKVEDSEEEFFECEESIFIASESGVIFVNNESNSTNEGEICEFNEEGSIDDLDDTKNMELDNKEDMENVNQSSLIVSSMEDDGSCVEDLTTSTSDCSQSQLPCEQVNDVCDVEYSVNADVDMTPMIQEQPSFVPANEDSEVKLSNDDYQNDVINGVSDCIEPRHTERLPSTRKAISPTSQEKLCNAMKSAELLDDMEPYKCKEKLSFDEQPDNKFSSTNSDVNHNEPNTHPEEVKPVITPKKPKTLKKTEKSVPPKGCLDGPRLCRSLPRLSTGCTTVEGCSESAIAFSQRQMHDMESLAFKLMSELNSMKVLVEEKLLFEAYRSPSLKNEADEVKSAIKSATKTEETGKKWLSMMARDCSRFCKIMKQNEEKKESGSDSMIIEEKVVQRERKKISFADEVGGMLCDVKVYEVDESSLELDQKMESCLE